MPAEKRERLACERLFITRHWLTPCAGIAERWGKPKHIAKEFEKIALGRDVMRRERTGLADQTGLQA